MALKYTAPAVPDTKPPKKPGPSPELIKAMKEKPKKVSPQKLEKLQGLAEDVRALRARHNNGEVLLSALSAQIADLERNRIPDFMSEIGVPAITVEAKGDLPGFTLENRPFYQANISQKWEPIKIEQGFDYLKSIGHDDLIRTEVVFPFPRGIPQKAVNQFLKLAKKIAVTWMAVEEIEGKGGKVKRKKVKKALEIPAAEVDQRVNDKTLTAWLRKQVEEEQFFPDLEKIGGFVGQQARPKFSGDLPISNTVAEEVAKKVAIDKAAARKKAKAIPAKGQKKK